MSTNVRFIWDNCADRASEVSATSEAGALVAANMQVDDRAAPWRSTTLDEQTQDWRWAEAQSVDSICFAWTNLSAAATVRAMGYTNVGDGSAVFDEVVAPDTTLRIGNTTVQNWIPAAHNIKQLKIIVADATNPSGYIEVNRAIIGKRIEPVKNWTKKSLSIGWVRQKKPKRTASFELRAELGRSCRRMKFNLDWLEPASRDAFVEMLANRFGQGVWVSAFPEHADPATRQLHAFWGSFPDESDMGYPNLNTWSAPVYLEEMG